MTSFDIGTLLDFNPPKYLCNKCRGILFNLQSDYRTNSVTCPVCKVKYLGSEKYPCYRADDYFRREGITIQFDNPIEHGRNLAAIAYNFNKDPEYFPPMRALLEAISTASQFIHFITYGLSRSLYGALKLKAQSIRIEGIASNIQTDFAKEIKENINEAPRLKLILFEQNGTAEEWGNIPHQKLVVIDGLMAFKGAANMTDSGWRKAATGRDFIEVVTNVPEVAKLHNQLFSPIWAENSPIKTNIDMLEIPF